MPRLNRRSLLAGAAATTALAATASRAQQVVDASSDLSGKTFLITGSSSGFGRLGALHYARNGAKVFATMRNTPRPEAEELQQIAADEKLDIAVLRLDVLYQNEINDAFADVMRETDGRGLDVLVNNAGIVLGGPVEVQDEEAMRLVFDTNVFGMHRVTRAALPAMRAKKDGLIVNISSQQGRVVAPYGGLYSASKFAVESMSEQLAYELVPHGIDVLIIEPGGFPTEVGQNRAKYTQPLYERIEPVHAAGYPAAVESMKNMRRIRTGEVPPGMPDPMMVPRAIASIAAMPAGTRPLRRPVHPDPVPQAAINRVARESQIAWLGGGSAGDLVRAVYD